jgi:polysaccharide export outer membrane protein
VRLPRLKTVAPALAVLLSVSILTAADRRPVPQDSEEKTADAGEVSNEYRIGVGDVLNISVWDQKALSIDGVPVRPDGMISLPLVRDVKAQGLTCSQLADRLTELVRAYVNAPTVTVVVKEINSLTIYVLGQVKSSGALYPKSRVRLLQAISMAGGFTPFAHGDSIVVLRKSGSGEGRITVSYDRIVSGKSPEQNILLQGGDTVIVP